MSSTKEQRMMAVDMFIPALQRIPRPEQPIEYSRLERPCCYALWESQEVYHAATPDYVFEDGLGERKGNRAVSLGERPYLDPQSTSRREAFKIKSHLGL
ncbi:hypothetical protein QBC45DRAFT_439212 [Copromyces sp. CBS 386.78]|nr:hypothetical protein QBC45DRAFT_439212 [Copromyces sp. CBS 386.78]